MRCKKCIKFLTFFITLVLSFVLFSNDTKAVEYNDASYKNVTGATLYYNNGGYLTFTPSSNSGGGAYWAGSGVNNNSGFNYLSIRFDGTIYAPSLITLVIKTQAPIGTYPQTTWGARSNRYTVVDQSFGEYGVTFLTLYTEGDFSGSIDLTPAGLTPNFNSADILISPIYTVTFVRGPTKAQLNTITTVLNNMFADLDSINARITDVNTNVTNILSAVRTLVDNSDRTADAVEEQNEKDDEDRSNLESQSSDTDSAAESSSEDAESTGTTLLGAFSAFVTALTNASPSNCNLDMDLGNLDLGVVNLCQLSPPQPIPTIASIFLILFCVPLSIATAKKVINLFRSFQ